MRTTSISPDQVNGFLESINSAPIRQKVKLDTLLLRPQVSFDQLIAHIDFLSNFTLEIGEDVVEIIEEAEILIKYEGYINKEKEIAEKLSKFDDMPLKPDFDYLSLPSLSTEARQKLTRIKPSTIGQASRISGISPSDISVLLVFLGR
jgi:tRNA uridine 5-carboxymethylaminomethyl modification enzyme